MTGLMVGVSGIRGIFGQSLTPDFVLRASAHFGIFCNRGKIILGRDSRTTGKALYNSAVAGLLSVGCEVVNLGIVSTPTLLLAVEDSDADGGICITASHNPSEWNAMKFADKNGMFLYPEKASIFIDTLDKEINYIKWNKIGSEAEDFEASQRHVKKIFSQSILDINQIRKKKFRVVLDSVNGAGGVISPYLLREMGCELIEINSEPNGFFAHNPEPLNKNLTQLEEAVKKHSADIGFATDPDVDRLAIVSEKGEAIGEEYSLLLAAKFLLKKSKTPIVTNLSTTMAIEDIAKQFDVEVFRTKVGEINVGKLMKEKKSIVGGEGNGGIIWGDIHYTRDAVAGMAIILALLTESDQTISEIVQSIPVYHNCKDKISSENYNPGIVEKKLRKAFKNIEIDITDGIKIITSSYWAHVRKSGTEPIVRIYTEAVTRAEADEICQKIKNELN